MAGRVALAQGTNRFTELRYPLEEYDAHGNIWREDRVVGSTLKSRKGHEFDMLDRLVLSSVQIDGATRRVEAYSYSPGGNLTKAGSANYRYEDAANTQAVTTIEQGGTTRALVYDDDGWLASDSAVSDGISATKTLAFDAAGCMTRVETAFRGRMIPETKAVTTSVCGLDGKRAYRATQLADGRQENVYYLPGGAELRPEQGFFLMKIPVGGATVAHLAWSLNGRGFVAEESGYIHSDPRGSVIARTGITSGNVRTFDREAEYDAWGNTLTYEGQSAPRHRYTGEEPDPATGYYYFGARAYDPTLRRWLSPDPLFLGTIEADAYEGTQLNLYSYAANNPVRHLDATGRWVDTAVDIASIGAGLAAISAWDENTSTLDKVLDVGGVLVDAVCAVLPVATAGVGLIRQGATHADEVVDGARAIEKVTDAKEAGDLAKAADKASDAPSGVCFGAGTLVHTEDGLRAIEDIDVGDLVWSRDELTGEVALRKVLRTFVTLDQPVLKLSLQHADDSVEELEVTGEHPFYTGGHGWALARDLLPGNVVVLISGETLRVQSVEYASRRTTVYNFEVDGFHTYFVGERGAWVHNNPCAQTGNAADAAKTSDAGKTADQASTASETGSYTNTHESGRTYDGKGDRARSQESGRRVEAETGDRHVATDWTGAKDKREAFKQESRRLDSHGGPKSPNNHNKIESPGKKMRKEDGEI